MPRTPDVLVVGGGVAGLWTAAAAARRRDAAGLDPEQLAIALVAPGDDMVVRPRLYEARPGEMRIPLRRFLEPIGVRHVRAAVAEVDVDRHRIVASNRDGARLRTTFGRLVVAAGSRLVGTDRVAGTRFLHDIDTLPAAVALDEHLHCLPSHRTSEGRFTAVVIGAGFVGLELATELVGRLAMIAAPHGALDQVRVVLVEREPVVGPELGPAPRPAIDEALDELGVERRLGITATALDGEVVRLSDGTVIPALTAIWTAGMEASPIARRLPGCHDALGRLEVDRHLRVIGVDPVFAAGDSASIEVAPGQRALQACQYAHQMGKRAGHNAVADLLGADLVEFEAEPYVSCVDLGHAGAVYTEGFERTVRATGAEAKAIKRHINRDYAPPRLSEKVAV